ncbi:MAG: tetratricopeptide repeat protein, partial [Gammaproteobacteria bacterium]
APWLAFAALAALVFAAYAPGLGGPFLLDDWGTLAKLGDYGPVTRFDTLISYLTAGIAGPTGRPLALASFLIDAHHWPANPWPFKLTNVLIHLLNGALLAWLLTGLSRARGLDPRKAAWAGLIGAGLWLAHPLFVSTTLYVVQRMAMLAALFVFAGLACYVTGRRRLNAGHTHSAYALMIGGLVGGTLLGFFSKENAALLPLLALVLEITVLRDPSPGSNRSRTPALAFRVIFLWLPSAFIFAFLLWQLRDLTTVVPDRDFSVGTRLLTEARVLVHYLYLLVIPHAATHGLYTVVPLSHDFLHPWTTLPAIVLILALIGGAFAMRRRWPVFAAVVLFFFAGQLLESTTIPLELYYEHRNYLPAALLFWPLALWWVRGHGLLLLRRVTLVLAFALLLGLTALRADLWGQPTRLALTWMRLNPDSVRAVVVGTDTLEALGRNRLAYRALYVTSKKHPDNISAALARIGAACRLGGARPDDVRTLVYAAGHDWARLNLLYTTLNARLASRQPNCPGFGPRAMAKVVAGARANSHFRDRQTAQQELLALHGQLLLSAGKTDSAYAAFRKALAVYPTPDMALTAGAYLLNAGHPRRARQLLNAYRKLPRHLPPPWTMKGLHRRWLDHSGWYRDSFRNLRHAIKAALPPTGSAVPR